MENVPKDLKIKPGSSTDLKTMMLINFIYQKSTTQDIPKITFLNWFIIQNIKIRTDLKSNKAYWNSK